MKNVFDKIVKWSIYSLVFLMPLFFLGFTFEAFEFNKQFLLLFLVSLGLFAWFAKMVLIDKEIRFKRTPLDLPILAFLGVAVLSYIFSVDKGSSLFGFYGRFSGGLIGLLSCGFLYFLITNNVGLREIKGTVEEIKGKLEDVKGKLEDVKGAVRGVKGNGVTVTGLVKVFLWSVGGVVAMSYFSVLGLWQKLSLIIDNSLLSLPRVMMQSTFNPVSGSMEGLAVFLSVVAVFLVGLILTRGVKGTVKEIKGTVKEIKGTVKEIKGTVKEIKGKLEDVKGELRGDREEQKTQNPKPKIFFYGVLLVAIMGLLVVIDFVGAWIVLAVSLLLFVAFAMWKRFFKEDVNKLLLPIVLVIVAAVFMVFNPLQQGTVEDDKGAVGGIKGLERVVNMPQEQVLEQGMSWKIAGSAMTENVKSAFLGSGVGAFHYDFAKFKPVEFNESALWQLRFDRAGSHMAEILATMGVLGLLAWFFLIGIVGKSIKGKLEDVKGAIRGVKGLPMLMVFGALVVSQFVYYQNTVLMFVFWLVLGLVAVEWGAKGELREIKGTVKEIKGKLEDVKGAVRGIKGMVEDVKGKLGGVKGDLKFSFKDIPEVALIFNVVLILIGLGLAGMYFQMFKIYRADATFAQVSKPGVETEQRIQGLEKAVKLNPGQAQYKIILARVYLNQALEEMEKPIEKRDQNLISENVFQAIVYVKGEAGQGASELAPNQVAAWETMGMIYRDIRGVAAGAEEWAIKSFEKAIELEPTNPVLRTELGKLYVETNKARAEFEKAIELKPDYIDARLQIVFSYEREENFSEAIRRAEKVAISYPFNVEVLFQLGRLYFNNERVDEAISQFQKVVQILPSHSNALYSLGVAYESIGKKELALQMFQLVLEMNPSNEDVRAKVEELR
jgi:tetratricopeptide (TPR) repeat protein